MKNGNIGWNIYALRMNKGWTQYDLADEAGIYQNTVWAIETGRIPLRRTLQKLADALDTDVATIIRGKVELKAKPKVKYGRISIHEKVEGNVRRKN